MLNYRGTFYSREHLWLSPNTNPDFWDFSFEEFGKYDLKAAIEYIQKVKQSIDKISIIGFSEGTTTSFYALSDEPEYFESKIDLFIALAPTIYFKHMKHEKLRNLVSFTPIFDILD